MFRASRHGHTPLVAALSAALALATSLVSWTGASADPFSATRAQIASLSKALAQEASQSEITANQYDAEKVALADLNATVAHLQTQVIMKRNQIASTTGRLARSELLAYILGASRRAASKLPKSKTLPRCSLSARSKVAIPGRRQDCQYSQIVGE